ncbi:MAG TPA: DUF2325 domain-containing protein [Methylophilaceae bacterium]
MTTALIVGGDRIEGIKQVLGSYGITRINHWSGRKTGDGKKVIPHDTRLIVLVTDWISHNFTHKIKQSAAKRGVPIVFTPNGPAALKLRLERLQEASDKESSCCRSIRSCLMHRLMRLTTSLSRILRFLKLKE